MPRILLTTAHRPMGVESDTCGSNVQAEMYHAQVTRAQDLFSIRSVCNGWGLQFIAVNLDAPVTVLHYPTKRRFLRELRKGYDFVGISFVMCTFPKAVEMCGWIRKHTPDTKIVLGGYGTVLEECDEHADYVCREEGVGFFRRLLGEPPIDRFTVPQIRRTLKVLSITTRPEAILPTGLGCSRGCDFCCTSHFFHRRSLPLLRTGQEIHDAMVAVDPGRSTFRNIGVIDEDFLADHRRIRDMIPLNATVTDKPIMFTCLTSLRSLNQYSTEDWLRMGLSGVWSGIESKRAAYRKLENIDAGAITDELHRVGIVTLNSIILGYDWHDDETIEDDFRYLMSLRPTFSQMMIYSPCPQTPLFERMRAEGRLRNIPYTHRDGFHLMFEHPHFSPERIEAKLEELFQREYEELGPSVCRVLDVQLRGYRSLRDHPEPLFRRRAEEYRKLCVEIYPLLGTAIRRAPSDGVRRFLTELKEQAQDELRISSAARLLQVAVPPLAAWNRLTSRLHPNPQPPTVVERYRWN
jgi:radical SAM superfamily enzyme YgiQ (UPF0313 family)